MAEQQATVPVVETDDTQYLVTYLNGASETVTGLANVRNHMINPELRDPSTKIGDPLDTYQGGTYWPLEVA